MGSRLHQPARDLAHAFAHFFMACAVIAGAGSASARDDFPNRPISLIVPVAAGGGVDGLARLIAPAMSEILKQSVVVENVPGAGGTVGLSRVAKAAPDVCVPKTRFGNIDDEGRREQVGT